MTTPRGRDGDGFDDGRPDGWQEPTHLGGGGGTPADPPPADRPSPDASHTDPTPTGATSWQPPGWDLPAVEPDRPAPPAGALPPQAPPPAGRPDAPAPWAPPAADQLQSDVPPPGAQRPRRGLGGLFGGRPREEEAGAGWAPPPPVVDPTDPYGTRAWAQQFGWEASDGAGPQDAALAPLLQSAPVRPGKDDRPGNVLRGRGNGLDLVAFDVLSPYGRGWAVTHAVTAAPVLGTVPAFRLTPARFWRHGTGGMLQVPSPDPEFDRRWVLLVAEDGPQVRRLAEDPVVRQTLLGTDDGDELWAAAGFVAAIRPDAHRPQLVEHHARLLAAVVGALAAAA